MFGNGNSPAVSKTGRSIPADKQPGRKTNDTTKPVRIVGRLDEERVLVGYGGSYQTKSLGLDELAESWRWVVAAYYLIGFDDLLSMEHVGLVESQPHAFEMMRVCV